MAALKDYYRDVKTELLQDDPRESDSEDFFASGIAPARGAGLGDIAQGTIDSGRQFAVVAETYNGLLYLLRQAQQGDPVAMGEVINRYNSEPNEIEVTITEPLRDSNGQEPERFGMKLIESEDEWDTLHRDFEMASHYFPGIELHSVSTSRRGKRLAGVVMGVTAREFNAVIAAERRKVRLEKEMKALDKNIERGRGDMGVGKMPRVPAGGEMKTAPETPPQARSAAKSVDISAKR